MFYVLWFVTSVTVSFDVILARFMFYVLLYIILTSKFFFVILARFMFYVLLLLYVMFSYYCFTKPYYFSGSLIFYVVQQGLCFMFYDLLLLWPYLLVSIWQDLSLIYNFDVKHFVMSIKHGLCFMFYFFYSMSAMNGSPILPIFRWYCILYTVV